MKSSNYIWSKVEVVTKVDVVNHEIFTICMFYCFSRRVTFYYSSKNQFKIQNICLDLGSNWFTKVELVNGMDVKK